MHTVTGWDMYRSPEFKTLCERFGIPWGLFTTRITLVLPSPSEKDETVKVLHEYVLKSPEEEQCPNQSKPVVVQKP